MVELTLFIRLSRDHLTAFSIEIVAVTGITTPWPSPIGLYKTEVINRRGPWRTLEVVELATLEWVDWFNHRRLLNPIGYVPPVECERIGQLPFLAHVGELRGKAPGQLAPRPGAQFVR